MKRTGKKKESSADLGESAEAASGFLFVKLQCEIFVLDALNVINLGIIRKKGIYDFILVDVYCLNKASKRWILQIFRY